MGIWQFISKVLLFKSFVLGTLILALWARSYWIADGVSVEVGGKSSSVQSVKGIIVYRVVADGSDEMKLSRMQRRFTHADADFAMAILTGSTDLDRGMGFTFQQSASESAGLVITTTVPHWFCFLLVGGKAIYWIVRRKARSAATDREPTGWCAACQMDQSHRNGQCVSCGSQVFHRAA